jgi:hypothetical protein
VIALSPAFRLRQRAGMLDLVSESGKSPTSGTPLNLPIAIPEAFDV